MRELTGATSIVSRRRCIIGLNFVRRIWRKACVSLPRLGGAGAYDRSVTVAVGHLRDAAFAVARSNTNGDQPGKRQRVGARLGDHGLA